MTTLHLVELGVLGPLQVRQDGLPVAIPGAKPRAILTMLGLRGGSVVSADMLVELLWGEDPPRTAVKALQTHISLLRRTLGDGFVLTEGAGWTLAGTEVDAARYKSAARLGRDAANAGDTSQAVARFEEALALWRGIPELPDGRRGTSEKTRWIEGHAALVEDRADALLATGRAAEIIGELEAAVADAPLRERRWGQLMLALYRAGRQGEALGAYQRARALLADELGVDPGPELRRLEAAIVAQDASLEVPGAQDLSTVTRAVTFLLTDIEGSTVAWEAEAEAMAVALARHDELVEQVVTSRGGRLIKTRGEGDATFSVFERPSSAAAAAIELQEAISREPWALREPVRIRVALHTGEVELRDGDYFGRAVNRAARLRSLAAGGQILCSGATAELVIDTLPDDVILADLGTRQLRNLARPEHVFELQLQTIDEQPAPADAPVQRPSLPAVLVGPGPFVGRSTELERLSSAWQTALAGGTNAVLIAGEPGVGKTRLAGEWSRQAYDQGALVIYGRCDEDLGAPYQPFAEALRALVPCLGAGALRGLRGVEALLPLVPGLSDVLPDLAPPTRADPDTERYALFDAVVALLGIASTGAPVVLILDDLHWAAKPTLLLFRHLLRFGEHTRVQIIGTYRSTDLDRSHPLAAMLADLHRDGTDERLPLSGLDEADVTAYVAEAGYDDEELARALASVTGGNPFFLIEALRHVDESGGRWDQSTLPQGVREAVSRRLSRLGPEANKALAAAAVVGSRFALELVERVVGDDLVDELEEACKAGIVIEEPGGRYRFNHALVRQSLLAELPSVRRMRLHQRIATTLEGEPGADDELLAELAYHYFECAWAGNAAKAVDYCRRAADQAMARLAYEGAAELYDRALHALEEIDDELPDRDEQVAGLLVARCEALLAAGDVVSAVGAVSQLQDATVNSARLSAWATCFDGQLSMLIYPERLDEVEAAVGAAAEKLAELGDAAGEAKAHTVRAGCLARLGRIGDCEVALDDALTAARRAREHRRVNNVLANAPLAALWGPNPVPRAGGRCLDVVRLLRITTDSPAVEATSTRCQAVLEAFRGRAEAARRMIDSARRTVTELGLRHALMEVEQFAGIVELIADEPVAAEGYLRRSYNGFRRMGLDADTAETAALLGRACLALDRDAEADELCSESERLAGHALKASIAWRTLRARLLVRGGDFAEARRVADAAVSLAENTDELVDHADACLALATVLGAAGESAGARAAAERAVGLYELKGAVALAEKARGIVGKRAEPSAATPAEAPAVKLDNACVRAGERLLAAVARRAWDELAQMYSPNAHIESRRKIVGFGRMSSADWVRANRPLIEAGDARINQVVIAVRGERLALTRLRVDSTDVSPGAPYDEFLDLYALDDEGLFSLQLWFDLDDIDAALAELDAVHARFEGDQPEGRRIATSGELNNACTEAGSRLVHAVNRKAWDELERLLAPHVAVESHRKIVGFKRIDVPSSQWPEDMRRYLETGMVRYRHTPLAVRGERLALMRLEMGTVDQSSGAPRDEMLQVVGLDEQGRIASQVKFDVEDFDAAMAELDSVHARLDEVRPRVPLENAASRIDNQLNALGADKRWDEFSALLADDIRVEDRRRGFRSKFNGRATALAEARAIAELGVKNATSQVLATRGQRLALSRVVFRGQGKQAEAYQTELLRLAEVDADNRIAAHLVFDLNDFNVAVAELDARYVAGEAAAYSRTWSAISDVINSINRHELPAVTHDWVNVDHRRGGAFPQGDAIAYLRESVDTTGGVYIETVHRLNGLGAVATFTGHGTSQEGFEAEWRGVYLLAVEGDTVNRGEVFDETDLNAAIARFEQLSHPAPQPQNAAIQAYERLLDLIAACDWDAVAAIVADDLFYEDRRRVVNVGIRHGRTAAIDDVRASAEVGFALTMVRVLATRGERLALVRARASGPDPDAIQNDALNVVEIDADGRFTALVVFDLGDFDAAIDGLDARYIAGEAGAYSHTWSVIARAYAALNRHELAATTPDWVNVDHRRLAPHGAGDLTAYIRAAWDDTADGSAHIESVHRLSSLGAVFTQTVRATSHQGFDAEWRGVDILTVDGDLIKRCERFDEADLHTAIARFEQLSRRAPHLDNAASRAHARLLGLIAAGDWDAAAETVADNFSINDRRRMVNIGILHGRDDAIARARAAVDVGFTVRMLSVIATRGERLALVRARASGQEPDTTQNDYFNIVDVDADGRFEALHIFDLDDFDAAIEELDARYVADEAAAYVQTWSLVTGCCVTLNRREAPATTADWANFDHRQMAAFAAGDAMAYVSTVWDLAPDVNFRIEAVHRLSNQAAVVDFAAYGTTQDGFDAEWRAVTIFEFDGGLIKRCDLFDDAEAAIARFDELSISVPRLVNAASRVYQQLLGHSASRDWDAISDLMADDVSLDDRRRVVGAGLRQGRDAVNADLSAVMAIGVERATSDIVATRGERLVLSRTRTWGRDQRPEAFHTDVLDIVEIDSDGKVLALIVFDLDDFDAAIEELDERYLAGEAAPYSHTWSVVVRTYAGANNQQLQLAPDCVAIDHRRARAFAPGELTAYMQATWDLAPNVKGHLEAVHRLSNLGAVVTHVVGGTSKQGFDAEWRETFLVTIDGDAVNRCEIFDEADVDAACERFEQLRRPAPRLENAASQAIQRFLVGFGCRDWDAMAQLLTDDMSSDDRRRVVNAGARQDRDAELMDFRSAANLGVTNATSDIIATRGERLALVRCRLSQSGEESNAFGVDLLWLVASDADERISAWATFETEDFEAAIAELDRRYLAGEAAAHARTWSVITRAYSALNRHEKLPTKPDWATVDHRRGMSFGPGEVAGLLSSLGNLAPDLSSFVEVVHRLNKSGAVVISAAHETSPEGANAEWRVISVITVEGDLINRLEVFDESDLDAAIARFEELSRPAPRLEVAASRVAERYLAHIAAGDRDAMAEILTEDFCSDDRRRVVGAGVRDGRDAVLLDVRAIAELSIMNMTSTVVATRGERVVLMRAQYSGRIRGQQAEVLTEVLGIFEIDDDERIVVAVSFDPDDFDAAIQELDARYLAGEAAPYAHTWTVIASGHAAVNRQQLPPTTPDCVSVDHRRGATFAPGDLIEYFRAGWDLEQNIRTYVEVVHRLNERGAVCTHVGKGMSRDGFEAEWRGVDSITVAGDMVSRCEVFDEADLDAAIERFDELNRPARRLENRASGMVERFLAHFAVREWDVMAQLVAEDFASDDRRRTLNAGMRRGRDAEMDNWRATAEIWMTDVRSTVVATRGSRLALIRFAFASQEEEPEAFQAAALGIVEIDDDDRLAASTVFEPEDFDAAFQELDARFLAGEAAPYADIWTVIAMGYAALNRHEMPATTPDCVGIDYRQGSVFASSDLATIVRAHLELSHNISARIEAVHRLGDFGAVLSHVSHETSLEGFEGEWRMIQVLIVKGDRINRAELFDEFDINAALARFDELSRPGHRLENAASQVTERFLGHYADRDWDAMTEVLASDYSYEDRRRVVGAGVRQGREAQILDMRVTAELWITEVGLTVIAIRGERLVLVRFRFAGRDQGPEAFLTEVLSIIEVDANILVTAHVAFDLEDVDAAFAELDARYLAGEAAAHADTWAVVSGAYAAMNRRELFPTAPDWVNVDHRRPGIIEEGGLNASLGSLWELMPDLAFRVEAVHRLTDRGAVCSHVAHGVSENGFDAEWRGIEVMTVDGQLIDRCEIFDEADLDAALARFDELHASTRRLKNSASIVAERFSSRFTAGDWDGMAELLADNYSGDDCRPVVGAGVRHGREAQIAAMRATADLWTTNPAHAVMAIRGERLALMRGRFSDLHQNLDPFLTELLGIFEINADGRIVAIVSFDVEDIDAAFEELEKRYVAGEAAPYAHAWSLIVRTCAAFNRHQLPPETDDCITMDHRRTAAFAPGEMTAYLRAAWDQTPQAATYVEAVHRLSARGAVVTYAATGTSEAGFDAEWRVIGLSTFRGGLIDRYEGFDEKGIDAAIAKFEELSRPAPQLENAASRVTERFLAHLVAGEWDAIAETLADDFRQDDRRRVVGAGVRHGRDAEIADLRAIASLGITGIMSTVLATRGERLVLIRARFSFQDHGPDAFLGELLGIAEINADEQVVADVSFDLGDLDAAFAELDARYAAGEAAPYARVWQLGMDTIAELNRHELGPMTGRFVYSDHRRIPFASGEDFGRGVAALWALVPDARYRVKTVHALDAHGSVSTLVIEGTDGHGNDLQWGRIILFAWEEPRVEIYEEDDVSAALARFEELRPQARRPENAASQADRRLVPYFEARDWDALAGMLADDFYSDDRRHAVNYGLRPGPDVAVANMQASAELGLEFGTPSVIATRGGRLVLARARWQWSGPDQPEAFHTEVINVVEINGDGRIAARTMFDADNIDAAFAELDARYLAGEASAHRHTWSVIIRTYAAFNRHELAAPDWVVVDHRAGALFTSSNNMTAPVQALWDQTPDLRIRIEAVHRLSDVGAVVTHTADGTSPEGFAAQWRMIQVLSVEGDQVSRCELFDEADVEGALARFDELNRQTRLLENAASETYERVKAFFAARDWAALGNMLADDICSDDRRRVVNAGIRHGRYAVVQEWQAAAGLGVTNMSSTVVATRGDHLVLLHVGASGPDPGSGAVLSEVLGIVETNADRRIAAYVSFDVDQIDAAFEELHARYLAGDAAPYSGVWQSLLDVVRELNSHQSGPVIKRLAYSDHRRVSFRDGDYRRAVEELWTLVPDARYWVQSVHALDAHCVVATLIIQGADAQGNELEWARAFLLDPDEPRLEIYEEDNVDAALARFEGLRPQPRRLENAASQLDSYFWRYFVAREWVAMEELVADDISADDRRRVINAGVRRGRDEHMADMRTIAEVMPDENVASTVLATRGTRLALTRIRGSHSVSGGDETSTEVLSVVEIDSERRIVRRVGFDLEDMDAAFAELDARYLAGEAAVHARTWSVVTQAYAALNRQEIIRTAPAWVNVDRRRLAQVSIQSGDLNRLLLASWELTPDLRIYVEAVHRLNDLGAVVTHGAHGRSPDGLDAEWRMALVLTATGELIDRCEIFDEADLDAALERFDELQPPTPRLENAASRVYERYRSHFAARDWTGMAELLTDETSVIDHRRVVNSGVRRGRDVELANMHAVAETGAEKITSTAIATRGVRLALCRTWVWYQSQPDAFRMEFLSVVEISADERISARVAFDPDDVDAAFEELDARYLAGEAAAHSKAWSVITAAFAGLNRHEPPQTTPAWVNADHRRGAAAMPGDLFAYIRAAWDLTPDRRHCIEVVHQLRDRGAILTAAAYGTSQEGVDAEWRMIAVLTFDGDLINHCEIFEEADLDAALARFEELQRQATRLENAATRLVEQYLADFARREWDAIAETIADDFCLDDRRRVTNAGIRHGRDAEVQNLRATAEVGFSLTISGVVGTRGDRLALTRLRGSGPEQRVEWVDEALLIVELDKHQLLKTSVFFDLDDTDAAFEELDARYLAGEAAAHSNTWSVITQMYAALNRHELPRVTPNWVNVDHRLGTNFAPGDLLEYLRAGWDLHQDINYYIEAVHRLSDVGAILTHAVQGRSQDGFTAEWRMIELLTVEADMVNRCELFDEANLDAATARFDELQTQPARLENAATQVEQRFNVCFAARDWDAMAELLSDDIVMDDRRRVVNAGVRRGRDAEIASERAVADVGVTNYKPTVIALRGSRLALSAYSISDGWSGSKVLCVSEINDENQLVARVAFDPDDVDAAFEELDVRYLACEAAAHSHAWSVIAGVYAGFNRHELPATTPDFVYQDHRPVITIEPTDLAASIRAVWELTPDISIYMETVHRLTGLGAVVTHTARGVSHEDFDAEWRMIEMFTLKGDLISRCEMFDEADLAAALARFDELHSSTRPLENAATSVSIRFFEHFRAGNWGAVAESLTDDTCVDDRRRAANAGIWSGRDVVIANMQPLAGGWADIAITAIATRGERLALARVRTPNRDLRYGKFDVEMLVIVEIDTDERITAQVLFGPDDFDAAFAELEARYLAGEAATHANTWSVIARAYAAFNRHELSPTTPDWVSTDHRRGIGFAPGDMTAYIRAGRNLTPDSRIYVEEVHRLTNLGAVVTQLMKATSQDGFDAEWRELGFLTVEGELISRGELFDAADLDVALAKFHQLNRTTPYPENAATRARARLADAFNRRDLDGFLALAAPDEQYEDRRKGLRDKQTAEAKIVRALFEVAKSWHLETEAVAVRGARLGLTRDRYRDTGGPDKAIVREHLTLMAVDDNGLVNSTVLFDPNDLNEAFAELTACWIASGEVAYPAIIELAQRLNEIINRHHRQELAILTAGATHINHRQLASPDVHTVADHMSSGQMIESLVPDYWIEPMEILACSPKGLVVQMVLKGTSNDGDAAEIPLIQFALFEGDRVAHVEAFDPDQRDFALARFEELNRAPLLENAATRVWARAADALNRRDADALLALASADHRFEDRRQGLRDAFEGPVAGRKSLQAMFETIPSSWRLEVELVAIRGAGLLLAHERYRDIDDAERRVTVELLQLTEVGDDKLMHETVLFDAADLEAAFDELEARYLAGEAATHSHTWSVILKAYAALNRRSVPPTTEDFEDFDHRSVAAFGPGELKAYIQATFDETLEYVVHAEVVHRLTAVGAVVTHKSRGVSREGFVADWRVTDVIMVEGDLVSRFELFDESDLAAALARFEELNSSG